MKFDKEINKGILTSLIGSIIFMIFLQPIMVFIWSFLKIISYNTYSSIVDSMYLNAALGQRNWLDFSVWTFLLIVAFFVLLNDTAKAKSVIDRHENEIKMDTLEKDELNKFLDAKFAKRKKEIIKSINFLKLFIRFKYPYLITGIILIMYFIFSAFTDLQLNTNFNQRLNAVAPYIDDKEIKILKSKWATMKNRSDFELINNQFENIAIENKIQLPKNLLN